MLSWASSFPQDEITVCLPSHSSLSGEEFRTLFGLGVRALRAGPSFRNHGLWALTTLGLHSKGFDAVLAQNFAPHFTSPRCTTVVFVHDALFVDHPEWFTRPERIYLSAIRPNLRLAEVILTSSGAEASRIGRVWPETRSRITAIGLGVPIALSTSASTPPEGMTPVRRPFILSVGRLNIRKNLDRLISAFGTMDQEDYPFDLVIVGTANGQEGSYSISKLPPQIRFLGPVSDAELNWLYRQAALFAFPSLDEGFGLPLLEARHFGAPSIASDIEPFREIGAAVGYFDPLSIESISLALTAALGLSGAETQQATPASRVDPTWTKTVETARHSLVQTRVRQS